MHTLLLTALLGGGPWVESSEFPQAAQEKAYKATLRLKVGQNEGTAVRVGRSGPGPAMYYLTAAHVVGDAKEVDLEWFDPKNPDQPAGKIPLANVIGRWPEADLALL